MYESLPDDVSELSVEEQQAAFVAALDAYRPMNVETEELVDADAVDRGLGTRFVELPEADARASYRDMEAFIDTVADRRLQYHLWNAINGRGAFRRFKDVLLEHPEERERWFAFKSERMHQRILKWLESEEIEPSETQAEDRE